MDDKISTLFYSMHFISNVHLLKLFLPFRILVIFYASIESHLLHAQTFICNAKFVYVYLMFLFLFVLVFEQEKYTNYIYHKDKFLMERINIAQTIVFVSIL